MPSKRELQAQIKCLKEQMGEMQKQFGYSPIVTEDVRHFREAPKAEKNEEIISSDYDMLGITARVKIYEVSLVDKVDQIAKHLGLDLTYKAPRKVLGGIEVKKVTKKKAKK